MNVAGLHCERPRRREAVAAVAHLNGIDYLEVTSEDQRTLQVHFLKPLPGEPQGVPAAPALTPDNVRVEGGTRVTGIAAQAAHASGRRLEVRVSAAGDFSAYTLRLVRSPHDDRPPPGFDPRLAAIDFSFKAACPSELDCRDAPRPGAGPDAGLAVDYLAKDYASFRRLMLERLRATIPDWQERSPADVQVALVEALAYVADELSYAQDVVATEAYLGTARRRTSVRRHARLLDYAMHDGCNARVWLHFAAANGGAGEAAVIAAGTPVLPGPGATRIDPAGAELSSEPLVFETLHAVRVRPAHNRIAFHTWGDEVCCLAPGATRATLRDAGLRLQPGDALLLEEIRDPGTALEADADPARRHVVRLVGVEPRTDPAYDVPVVDVRWHEEDALPFALCLSVEPDGAAGREPIETGVARGNMVLADHGRWVDAGALGPVPAPAAGPFRPSLPFAGLTFAQPYDHAAASAGPASALARDPRAALARVLLDDGETQWQARRDLLASDRFAPHFVVETEDRDRARLRFGDDEHGRAPEPGTRFSARLRIGNGAAGNVGAESLRRVVTDQGAVAAVRNPLPAGGGREPETVEQVRHRAPRAFRHQRRAVTEADWETMSAAHPQVQRAAARYRWSGSWFVVEVALDRRGGLPVDAAFRAEMHAHLEPLRLAGYDLAIRAARYVALDVTLDVCVRPGRLREHVHEDLLRALGTGVDARGRRGFFHPDAFSFGDPLYLSRLYERAVSVDGVRSVRATRFQRFGELPGSSLDDGVVRAARHEILRLDNDPSAPEAGVLRIALRGGA